MGYADRCWYALEDLDKLITYKTKRGISLRWQTYAYSYLHAFRKGIGLPPTELPEGVDTVEGVSIRDTNETICRTLRITPTIATKLDLQTLRLDAEQYRKRRYHASKGNTTREGYLMNCQHHQQQMYQTIQIFLQHGMSKTDIAKKMGISRNHLYRIIRHTKNQEEYSS